MRRVTILNLMGLILALAVAIAALRDANDYWAGGMLLATCLLIGVATLGAAHGSGRRRAGRLGFAVFAGGYFALAFLGLSENNLAKLPTSRLLSDIHQQVSTPQSFVFTIAGNPPGQVGQGTIFLSDTTVTSANTVTLTAASQVAPASNAGGDASQFWRQLLPGAADYAAFGMIGHCQFALLAGLLGALIARRLEKAKATSPEPAT